MILLPRYISGDNVRSLQKEQRRAVQAKKVCMWEKKDHQRMRVITDYRARDSCYAETRDEGIGLVQADLARCLHLGTD